MYNRETHTCQNCPLNQIYDNVKMKCVCPEDHPFSTSKGCIQCYLPNYFDIATESCLSCPKNQVYHLD